MTRFPLDPTMARFPMTRQLTLFWLHCDEDDRHAAARAFASYTLEQEFRRSCRGIPSADDRALLWSYLDAAEAHHDSQRLRSPGA